VLYEKRKGIMMVCRSDLDGFKFKGGKRNRDLLLVNQLLVSKHTQPLSVYAAMMSS